MELMDMLAVMVEAVAKTMDTEVEQIIYPQKAAAAGLADQAEKSGSITSHH